MAYEEALEAAGAVVHAFGQFGDYQGTWWAKVTYNGEVGWTNGSYGSCSGCDAFEAEFGFTDRGCDEHRDSPRPEDCLDCKQVEDAYNIRLADFGRSYLDDMLWTTEKALEEASRNLEWDSEAKDVVKFIKEIG